MGDKRVELTKRLVEGVASRGADVFF